MDCIEMSDAELDEAVCSAGDTLAILLLQRAQRKGVVDVLHSQVIMMKSPFMVSLMVGMSFISKPEHRENWRMVCQGVLEHIGEDE